MAIPSPYWQLPLVLPTPAPDRGGPLAAARIALAAADRAADSSERRRITAVLATQLADVAHARGRQPVPKPGHRAPSPASARS